MEILSWTNSSCIYPIFSEQACQKCACLQYIRQVNIQKLGVRVHRNLHFFKKKPYLSSHLLFQIFFYALSSSKEEPVKLNQHDFVNEELLLNLKSRFVWNTHHTGLQKVFY